MDLFVPPRANVLPHPSPRHIGGGQGNCGSRSLAAGYSLCACGRLFPLRLWGNPQKSSACRRRPEFPLQHPGRHLKVSLRFLEGVFREWLCEPCVMEQEALVLPMGLGQAVQVISPAPRDLWRSALAADPDTLLSQTPEWTDLISAVDGWTDASRLYFWPSGRHLVLPMMAKRSCGLTLFEASLPAGWGYGGLVGGRVTPDEAATVYADLSASYPLRRSLCPNCTQGAAWSKVTDEVRNATILRSRAHAVKLDGGVGSVWKRFSENARRCVRKAEKQGLEVECDTTGGLLGVFHELWLLSTERWARRSRHPLWLVRSQGRRLNPDTRWKQIAKHATGAAAIWIAHHRGQPVAGIVVLRGPNDHYTRGAMDQELAGPTRANFLLHWLAIQDACQRGSRWYQMGRSGPSDGGVSRFKESFGAISYEFPEIRLERLPLSRFDQAVRRAAKRLICSRTAQPSSITQYQAARAGRRGSASADVS